MGKGKTPLTYAAAGVDIEAGNKAVQLMRRAVRSTFRPEVLGDIGGFGSLFALDTSRYREPVLVSGTDGVGTKLKVAFLMDKHDTIGIDAVAMCANDILTVGAEPLFFLDYLAVGKLQPEKVAAVVSGVAEGCRQAGCALVGGETAEMPDFYAENEYDLAGFIVGVVDKTGILDGSNINPGDFLIGLPSSGLHSNGYSLARKAFLERAGLTVDSYVDELGRTVGEELLEPTRIYVQAVTPLLKKGVLKGIAHITGGGLRENIPRMLPAGLGAEIFSNSWDMHPVFKLLQSIAAVDDEEMARTFNLGIGLVMAVSPSRRDDVLQYLQDSGEKCYLVGRVIQGEGVKFTA